MHGGRRGECGNAPSWRDAEKRLWFLTLARESIVKLRLHSAFRSCVRIGNELGKRGSAAIALFAHKLGARNLRWKTWPVLLGSWLTSQRHNASSGI